MPGFQSDFALSVMFLSILPICLRCRTNSRTQYSYDLPARWRAYGTSQQPYLHVRPFTLPSSTPPFRSTGSSVRKLLHDNLISPFPTPIIPAPGLPTSSSASLSYEKVGRVPDEAVVSGRSRVSDGR